MEPVNEWTRLLLTKRLGALSLGFGGGCMVGYLGLQARYAEIIKLMEGKKE